MKRKFDLKFICLSLLMAGVGMFITACSSEDDNPEKPETRGEENVVSDADPVVLDADTLKVFDDYAVKFQLLNSNNQPVTIFKEGENFTFQLSLINLCNELIAFPIDVNDIDYFSIYTDDGTFWGKPWDFVSFSSGAICIAPKESFVLTCRAFGEKDYDPDGDSILPIISLSKTQDRAPLPKDKYYTEFKFKLNNEGESIILRKEFRIE